MSYLDDQIAPEYYSQATDSGQYDDVEMYGPEGDAPTATVNSSAHLAWMLILLALAGLWLMGGALFKGSNHS